MQSQGQLDSRPSWGAYLASGVQGRDQTEGGPSSIAEALQKRGWTTISLDDVAFCEDEAQAIRNWEAVFASAFQLSAEEKEASGLYRTENGVSVGYRTDDEREFFETRVTSDSSVEPFFPNLPAYTETVLALYRALNRIAHRVLDSVAACLGVDKQFFLDLTDVECNGVLPEVVKKDGVHRNLSSSLLRVCRYSGDDGKADGDEGDKRNWFGAHTDSSFITIALLSSTPGLDIVDQAENRWVCPEHQGEGAPARVVVFAGEFLQVLSKSRFKAAVHRVRNVLGTADRVSCPYLLRGRHDAVIQLRSDTYAHPGGADAVAEDKMPNLDDISVKLMHKLLDLKRQKCFRDNGSAEGSWVLSAYPVPPLPED